MARALETLYHLSWKGRIARALLPLVTMTPHAMAAHAKTHTAIYRKLYAGLDPADFDHLPLLTKNMARQASPFDFLSDWYKDKAFYYGETTGSSGRPTPSFMMKREYYGIVFLAAMTPFYGALSEQLRRNRICVNGMSFGFTIAGESYSYMMVHCGALVANVGSRSTLATPERTADAISRLKPGFIVGTPIDLLAWMRIVREDHREVYDEVARELSIFLSSAELCSTSRRKAIEKHFGLIQIDTYATVEGFFSVACPCGGKHLVPMYLVELFDENLQKIGSFGRGRLVFTNLAKRSTPLVRYLLDDLVTVRRSEACPWGYDMEIVPHGRYELSVRIRDELLNVGDFEEEIFAEGLFGDYRVRLFDDNRAEVILEDYAVSPGAEKRVEERLRARFGLDCRAELKPYGFLTPYREPRTAKGILKVEDRRRESRQIVPEVL